jgi:hypothetical protein
LELRCDVPNSRKFNWRRIAWIAGILFAVWVIVEIVLAGGNTPPPPSSQPITLRGGRVSGNHITTRSWKFDYTKAQMSPDGILATLDGVKNGILYKKGKPYLSIAAQHVSVNTQTFDFTATGDVHIEALNPNDGVPKSFDTDLVQWVNATKILQLPHPSLFRTADQTLKVATITVDFNKSDIHLGNVNGSIEAPGP